MVQPTLDCPQCDDAFFTSIGRDMHILDAHPRYFRDMPPRRARGGGD